MKGGEGEKGRVGRKETEGSGGKERSLLLELISTSIELRREGGKDRGREERENISVREMLKSL